MLILVVCSSFNLLSVFVSMNCFRWWYSACIMSGGCFVIGILVLLVLVFRLVVGLSSRFL